MFPNSTIILFPLLFARYVFSFNFLLLNIFRDNYIALIGGKLVTLVIKMRQQKKWDIIKEEKRSWIHLSPRLPSLFVTKEKSFGTTANRFFLQGSEFKEELR